MLNEFVYGNRVVDIIKGSAKINRANVSIMVRKIKAAKNPVEHVHKIMVNTTSFHVPELLWVDGVSNVVHNKFSKNWRIGD